LSRFSDVARLQQVRQLLGKHQQLTMRDFQVLRFRRGPFRAFAVSGHGRNCIDSNRNAALLLDLAYGHCAIGAIQHTFNQTALRVSRPISKLWHRGYKLLQGRPISKSGADRHHFIKQTSDLRGQRRNK